jgi:DNA-binding NtrC family response regulator
MPTILVVDDDPDVLESLEALLSGSGYSIVAKSSATDAIETLKQSVPVDLIVSDYRMPSMDGKEFLERLRMIAPAVPVIILTACGSVETYLASLGLGAYEFLHKPVLGSELRRVVRAALQGGR